MIHPSYSDLMAVANTGVEPGEQPVVQSRYSIVLATAKRARQIVNGSEPHVDAAGKKRAMRNQLCPRQLPLRLPLCSRPRPSI